MAARWKLLLATFAVTLALANCVGAASARNISVNNSGFRIVWTPMTITARETVECDVTMEGTFHYRTFVKMRGLLIGNITRAIVRHETCRGGDFFALNGAELLSGAVVPQTLPWNVRYEAFTGTLPNIATVEVSIETLAFLHRPTLGQACLYQARPEQLAYGNFGVAGGNLATFRWREERTIRLFNGVGCSNNAVLSGTGVVTQLGSATLRVGVTLI
jgi:hypothetical protein